MKLAACLMTFFVVTATAVAQETSPLTLRIEARGDVECQHQEENDKYDWDCSERFINLRLDGAFSPQWSYSYRHRLNKIIRGENVIDAMDWLYVTYKPTATASLSAGKQVVAIGGYEYDRAPIHLYFCSEFWNQVPCYQWGASATWHMTENNHLTFQFSQSPFRSFWRKDDMFAYNMMWTGAYGLWHTLWSVNAMEWRKGRFINYIALGNRFEVSDKVSVEADLLNRASSHQQFLLRDCTLVGELSYRPCSQLNLFAKASYDVNRSGTEADLLVKDGTEVWRAGGGVEFYPLKKERMDLRVHANYCYTWGKNGNENGALQDGLSVVDFVITWTMQAFSIKKRK